MIVCWSVKGGSGTSVVSALLSLAVARRSGEALLVDLDGDQPSIFGVEGDTTLGARQWLQAGSRVPPEALTRLVLPVGEGLDLVPSGPVVLAAASVATTNAERLNLALRDRPAIVDAGVARSTDDLPSALTCVAAESLLVIRPCYLAVRRASFLSLRTTGIVIVEEPNRALDSNDVADVLGAPIVATVRWDAAIARAVDAGRLLRRRWRAVKSIENLAHSLADAA